MRRAFFLLLLLVAADGAAGPRCTRGRGCDRGSGGDDVVFTFAPASGQGLPSVADLCDAYSSEMTGSYYCLRGDGTFLSGSRSFSATGSPSTTTYALCPNGSDCSSTTSVRLNGTSQWYESSAAAAAPSGDFSVCGAVNIDTSASGDIIGQDDGGGGGTGRSFVVFITAGSPQAYVFKTDGSFSNIGGAASSIVTTARHFVCFTYDFVADGSSVMRLYVDGAASGSPLTTAVGPAQASASVKTRIGGRVGAGNPFPGRFSNVFLTEKVLDPTTIAAMARTVLADQPRSTQGHALTLSRASAKFCAKSDQSAGTLLPASRPCIRNGGIEVEGGSTNLILQSGNLGNAAWTASGGVVAAPTVTANTTDLLAPDGTNTATKIVYPAVSGASAFSVVFQQFVATAVAHSQSLYLRTASGTATVYMPLSSGGTYKTATCSVSTTWTRCLNVNQTLTAATWTFSIGVDLRDAGQSSKSAQTVYAWGGQTEADPTGSSYIATAGTSVTRAIEQTVTFSPAPTGISTTEGCTKLTFVPSWSSTPPNGITGYLLSTNSSSNGRVPYFSGSVNDIRGYDGTHISTWGITYAAGTASTVRTTWSATANAFHVRADTGSAGTSPTAFTSMGTYDQFLVGVLSGALTVPIVYRDITVGANSTACGSTP